MWDRFFGSVKPYRTASVHLESGANDRALGIAMRVAVTQQPGPEGRVYKLLQSAPDGLTSHMLRAYVTALFRGIDSTELASSLRAPDGSFAVTSTVTS